MRGLLIFMPLVLAACGGAASADNQSNTAAAAQPTRVANAETSAANVLPAAAPAPIKNAKTLPATLVGVWHSDDADGRSQCSAYKKSGGRGSDGEPDGSLVGAAVIREDLIHAYAEYGEGNMYAVKTVKETASGQWRVDAMLGIDGEPSAEEPGQPYPFTLKLDGDKLDWSFDDGKTEHYVRCGPLPAAG